MVTKILTDKLPGSLQEMPYNDAEWHSDHSRSHSQNNGALAGGGTITPDDLRAGLNCVTIFQREIQCLQENNNDTQWAQESP